MELVLPNNYVALEQEEMMYLDGGRSFQRVTQHWWGMRMYMTQAQSRNMAHVANQVSVGATGLGALTAKFTGGASLVMSAITVTVAQLLRNSLNHHTTSRGVVLSWAGLAFWSRGR